MVKKVCSEKVTFEQKSAGVMVEAADKPAGARAGSVHLPGTGTAKQPRGLLWVG